jgi:chromosome segregation protein
VFLRSLTARGFKSFADKTTLEFAPGISVIVGPNGSGKSNIVDAIAWVLGEQGPHALRGGAMTDVIFEGGPARPALGLAEVRMVIDNSAGRIPVPASEIEISRVVYRSGESEYRMGGRPCRLLDIQELLSDTGMGRAQHTIVGQGQLDALLQARPEERRQLIEEAAGIAKHRRRRERAERKLSGLEQDLLRLQDLVAELRRQLKPLKQQAELAERHETLVRQADQLALKLAAARLRELHRNLERRRPSWQQAESRQAEIRARQAELDERIARLESEHTEAESRQREAEDLHADTSRAKSEAEQRLRTAMREEADARERLNTAVNRSGRLFALEEELERTERASMEVAGSLAAREAELEDAEREFRRATQARRDAEDERRSIGEAAAARRAEAEALERALAGNDAEIERTRSSLADLTRRMDQAAARAAELEVRIERLDEVETPLAEEQASLEKDRVGVATSVADLESEEKGLLARQEVVDSRMAELAESPGAAFVRRRGERPLGVLRDLIAAPFDLRLALRGALGPYADAVVFARRDEAVAEATAPGATGLTLAVAGSGAEAGGGVGTGGEAGTIQGERRLIDLIRPDPRVRGLVAAALAEVYVVQNLAEAATKHRVHPSAQFVAPDGAVVGPSFVRTPPGHDERLDEARRASASLERELSAVRRGLREARQSLAELTAQADVGRTELEKTDRLITAAADELSGVRSELTSLRREHQLFTERLAAVEASAAVARERLAALPGEPRGLPSLPPMPELPLNLRVEVEALRRERGRLDAGVLRCRREVDELQADDPIVLRERVHRSEAERAAAEELLRNADGNLSGAVAAARATADVVRLIQATHAEANRAWRETAASAEWVRTEFLEQDQARRDIERRTAESERVLREGHSIEPREALAMLAGGDTVEDLQRQADLVARRLTLVGKVNLLATGELEALQQRHDFLVRELEDVRLARRNLQEVIDDVDRKVADLFASAFEDVAREFSNLFQMMFPGGEGKLTLENPDDLLGSGIEVEARPSRGRVRRLSLLSGGERSLAALAFLFAIFRARPSPFYLMDEVEAALDDINLHRFLEVVKEFARESQILIVTHQKRTMEIADIMYGVSMNRDGASRVISQRLVGVPAR